MYKQTEYETPIYGKDGYCFLDYLQLWMMQAIHRRDSDDAYHQCRKLYHLLFKIRMATK